MSRITVVSVIGTRPEAIKMAPVIRELEQYPEEIRSVVVATGQHRQMLDQTLAVFGIVPAIDLNIMRPDQSLTQVTTAILESVGPILESEQPDWVLVQGDTTTAFAVALAAAYRKIPVAHVEAGLRSFDPLNPYPEEMNRRLIDALADYLFAPTPAADVNLRREGVPEKKIFVTGNTVVDALLYALTLPCSLDLPGVGQLDPSTTRLILVTSHRRENWDEPLRHICDAFKELVARFPDVHIVYPVHLNPNVRRTVMVSLDGVPRIHLTDPVDYLTLINLMKMSYLILTDSGGIQEEAPTLHKPVLVLRRVTERPEACDAGLAKVVGTEREAIVRETSLLLTDPDLYRSMSRGSNPFGDGRAAARIVRAVRDGRPS